MEFFREGGGRELLCNTSNVNPCTPTYCNNRVYLTTQARVSTAAQTTDVATQRKELIRQIEENGFCMLPVAGQDPFRKEELQTPEELSHELIPTSKVVPDSIVKA